MTFKPGKTGNPRGRPKGRYSQKTLEAAIRKVEKEHPELPGFLEDTIIRSYKDARLRKALLDKLVPSLRSIEGEIKSSGIAKVNVYLQREDGTVVDMGADNSGDDHGGRE